MQCWPNSNYDGWMVGREWGGSGPITWPCSQVGRLMQPDTKHIYAMDSNIMEYDRLQVWGLIKKEAQKRIDHCGGQNGQ